MCDIPDNYMCVDDVIEELKGIKAGIEIKTEEIVSIINEAIRDLTGENKYQEPLRTPVPITNELENSVQKKLDSLGEPK